jgi:hypothetical protein
LGRKAFDSHGLLNVIKVIGQVALFYQNLAVRDMATIKQQLNEILALYLFKNMALFFAI